MKARVKWVEQVSFLGETESGHAVLMDGAPAAGGRNLGPRPMEMLLLGMGGCTSFDVIGILKKVARRCLIVTSKSRRSGRKLIQKCSPKFTCILW